MKTWLTHFKTNQLNRPEPDWDAPIVLPPGVLKPLLKSIEQFQLGDGGGPGYLIAWNRESFLSRPGNRQMVDLWFAEEHEHSRLLGEAVDRFGGTRIDSHWSFSVFCLTRKWFGVKFELTVLLLTEIVSTGYYKLLRKYCPDAAIRGMCDLILRDEAGHVAYHRDRLAGKGRARGGHRRYGFAWLTVFRVLELAAGTMLWINHSPALKAMGATTAEYYREIWGELSRFTKLLRRECRVEKFGDIPETSPASTSMQ